MRRKGIALIERLASALADKLTPEERAALRDQRIAAREVVKMFTADHIELHAWGGSDRWWNLDMKRRDAELKAKDASDTSRAAKAVRIDSKWDPFMRRISRGLKPKPPPRKPWGYHTRGRQR